MINEISVRFASVKDAGLIARLAETTFRDAFQDHPKNAPHDLEAYISQAFTQEQIGSELADSRNVFMIAEIGGEAAVEWVPNNQSLCALMSEDGTGGVKSPVAKK